jgi:Na+/proline symporter
LGLPVLIGYLLLQLLIGYYISKKIQNESDYLVAGRNLPMWVVALSLYATWFGAETCIGSSAEVYLHGLSGSRADPLGYSLCLFFAGFLLAKKIWNKKYFTLADFYKDRFGEKTEKLSLWILSISSLVWIIVSPWKLLITASPNSLPMSLR